MQQHVRLFIACAVAASSSCIGIPNPAIDPAAYSDAIGNITISAPIVVPVAAATEGKQRLNLESLYDEENLRAMIEQPDLSSTILQFDALRVALAGTYGGRQISDVTTLSSRTTAADGQRDSSATQTRDVTESQKTPTVDTPTFAAGASPAVQTAFEGLLNRLEFKNKLAPDQLASLIASNKVYMVNLEQYYNFGGSNYGPAGKSLSGYRPYKMSFTVTAEPGWHTRKNLMDAVIEAKISSTNADIRVLTVAPAETSQAIDDFSAAMQKTLQSLSLAGSGGTLALDGRVERVKERGQRLQGLSSNKTLTVGYPDEHSFRIRFRPNRTATRQGRDLQPISRVLTAYLLIKPYERAVTFDASMANSETLRTRVGAAEIKLELGQMSLEQRGYFAPSLRTKDGKAKTARWRDHLYEPFKRILGGDTVPGHQRRYPIKITSDLVEEKSITPAEDWRSQDVEIPLWLGDAAKPLSDVAATGRYWYSSTDALAAAAKVAAMQVPLDAAKAKQAKAKDDLKEKQAALAVLKKKAAKKSQSDKTGDQNVAAAAVARATLALRIATDAVAAAKGRRDLARAEEYAAWPTALKSGRFAVNYTVRAPRSRLNESNDEVVPVYVYGRISALSSKGSWKKLGQGDISGAIHPKDSIDLSGTSSKSPPTSLRDFGTRPITAVFEVIVAQSKPPLDDPLMLSQAIEFELKPSSSTAPITTATLSKPRPKNEPEACAGTVGIKIGQVELRMGGKVDEDPTPAKACDPKQ